MDIVTIFIIIHTCTYRYYVGIRTVCKVLKILEFYFNWIFKDYRSCLTVPVIQTSYVSAPWTRH